MHIHEWETRLHHHNGLATYTDIWCAGCNTVMQWTEVASRLNATEMLSAGAADYAAEFTQAGTNTHSMDQESEGNIYYLTDALRAYASALDGEAILPKEEGK